MMINLIVLISRSSKAYSQSIASAAKPAAESTPAPKQATVTASPKQPPVNPLAGPPAGVSTFGETLNYNEII